MAAKKPERVRLTVVCTPEQAKILDDGAKAQGMASDRSAWILAHALAASARATGATANPDAPLEVPGPVAQRFRAAAERQGVTVERLMELALLAAGA